MKTKIPYLILGSTLMITGIGKAQWSSSGGNIYQTTLTNNVGIGTTGPNCPLQINNATTFGNLSSGGTWDVGFNHQNAAAIGNNPNVFLGMQCSALLQQIPMSFSQIMMEPLIMSVCV